MFYYLIMKRKGKGQRAVEGSGGARALVWVVRAHADNMERGGGGIRLLSGPASFLRWGGVQKNRERNVGSNEAVINPPVA